MRINSILITIILLFLTTTAYAGENAASNLSFSTVEELTDAVNSQEFFSVIMAMDTWLPDLVKSVDWETAMSDRFMILYTMDEDADNNVMLDTLLTDSEDIYKQLESFFHIEAKSKQDSLALKTRLLNIIVSTKSDRTFGALTDPHRLFYLMDSGRDLNFHMEKLRHEYAHWAWGRLYGEAPSLFNEGIANYAEIMSQPDASLNNFLKADIDIDTVPPLSDIAFNDNFWKHTGMYTVGGLFVHYLVETYGWDTMKKLFLESTFEDKDILIHFGEVYGISLEEADKGWRNYISSL